MDLSDFQTSYHKLLVFHMDILNIKHLIWRSNLSVNQIDLLLSAIGIVFSRLNVIKSYLERKKVELNEKKNEQTLF